MMKALNFLTYSFGCSVRITVRIISVLLLVGLITAPPALYAQNDKSNNTEKDVEEKTNKFIRFNKSFSKGIDRAAEGLDKGISPKGAGTLEENKTNINFILGGDFADNGDMESNFRFGAQLHLPRFERYWKLKFDNQNEKRDRGQSSVVRSQRTRNSNDDVFVGVSFKKNWDRISVDYKPQIAIKDGAGLDHSVEAQTEFVYGKFHFEPGLEFFANHDDATGSSASLKLTYWLYKKTIALQQGNDGRFLFLDSELSVNHYGGVLYVPTDRLQISTHYFRSFENKVSGFMLAAYGTYLTTSYTIYKDMLEVEARPYIVFERAENFRETHGMVLNFRIIF